MDFKRFKKGEEGFTGQDILVAIFIVTLFLSLIGGIFINLSKTSREIRLMASITDSLTKMCERVDALTFDQVKERSNKGDISQLISTDGINRNEDVKYTYVRTTTLEADGKKKQNITLTASYNVNGMKDKIEVTVSKKALNVDNTAGDDEHIGDDDPEQPNPTGSDDGIEPQFLNPFNAPNEISGYLPIKVVWRDRDAGTKYWVTTSVNDKEWYSIEEGAYPIYHKPSTSWNGSYINSGSVNINGTYYTYFNLTSSSTFYMWFPRLLGTNENYSYAYDITNYQIINNPKGGYNVGNLLYPYAFETGGTAIFGNSRGLLQAYQPSSTNPFVSGSGITNYGEYIPTTVKNAIYNYMYKRTMI